MSNGIIWATEEINRAKNLVVKAINDSDSDPETKKAWIDVNWSLYDSVLEIYNHVCKVADKDGHSGMSYALLLSILDDLLDGRPLTPITEDEDEWQSISFGTDPEHQFMAKRRSSLFKTIKEDGTIDYADTATIVCRDQNGGWFYNGFIADKIRNLYPITFPYTPPKKKYVVTVEERQLIPELEGKCDTDSFYIMSVKTPDGVVERIEECYTTDVATGEMKHITAKEYDDLVEAYIKRTTGESNDNIENNT